ncbi:protein kinase [Planctomycetota bacterium]
MVERAAEKGLLTGTESEQVIQRLDHHLTKGGRCEFADVLREIGVVDERIADLDLRILEGRTLGGFHLLKAIGLGGVGIVFLAEQLSLGRIVAVKVLDPVLARVPEIVERFRREARGAARLAHPHVVSPIDFGEDDGTLYFAMEYLEGGTAGDRLAESGPLEEREALQIARKIAEALVYAAKVGMLHRDIKPSNILFDCYGEPKLADLGLVLDLKHADPKLTARGMVMGSPHYMAPEQATSQRNLDARTDLYAVGITLFELLTGQPPFTGVTGAAILAKHVSEPLPDLRELVPEISEPTRRLVERLCAKDPIERPQAARIAVVEIDRVLAELDRAGGEGKKQPAVYVAPSERDGVGASSPKAPAPAARGLWRAALTAGLTLAFLAILAVAYYSLRGPIIDPIAEERAVEELKTLLLSKRALDGGYGEGVGHANDPWVSSQALLALSLLEDPELRPHLGELVSRFPKLSLDGAAAGDPPGFAGFPYCFETDNVACLEATSSVGISLAVAKGRVDIDVSPVARDVFEYLLEMQSSDGSWATVPVLHEAGAMTAATAGAVAAVAALACALSDEQRAYPAVESGARWLCHMYVRKGSFFDVNPRRRYGGSRSVAGLNGEATVALLEARALTRRIGRAESELVRETLVAIAASYEPFEHEPEYVGIARPEDYQFVGIPIRYRATTADDRWIAYAWRLLVAARMAEETDLPRTDEWAYEVRRLRSRIPELAERFRDRPTWHLAEVLMGAATLRAPRGEAGTTAFVDLVR